MRIRNLFIVLTVTAVGLTACQTGNPTVDRYLSAVAEDNAQQVAAGNTEHCEYFEPSDDPRREEIRQWPNGWGPGVFNWERTGTPPILGLSDSGGSPPYAFGVSVFGPSSGIVHVPGAEISDIRWVGTSGGSFCLYRR